MTGQRIGTNGISYLGAGIQASRSLKKLILPRNGIRSIESITTLCYALQSNNSVEFLDLSENNIDDNAAEAIKELIKNNETIQNIKLDHNLITNTCFAVSLCQNNYLSHFSVEFNPLSFENFISLLEMLNINRNLKFLGLKGIKFSGPANIKENQSGILTMQEALILKLANVLRNSSLQSISIDLDSSSILQLRELEVSLLKHNSTLINICSDSINWSINQQGPLLGIQRALKANSWLIKNEFCDDNLPRDIESIINAKRSFQRPSNKLKDYSLELDSNIQFFSNESGRLSPNIISPDFSIGNSHLSDLKYPTSSRTNKPDTFDNFSHKNLNKSAAKLVEELDTKMQGFQEEIIGQVNILYERIHELETNLVKLNNFDSEKLAAKVAELEKKDESNQNLILLANREISELKSVNSYNMKNAVEELKKQFNSKLQKLEKKIKEDNELISSLTTKINSLESRFVESSSGEINCIENDVHESEDMLDGFCENNLKSDKDFKVKKKLVVDSLPGTAETLVMKAIHEKNYWTIRKKLDFGKECTSQRNNFVENYFSPDDCPSKDLHERLINKGLNFISRSASARKRK